MSFRRSTPPFSARRGRETRRFAGSRRAIGRAVWRADRTDCNAGVAPTVQNDASMTLQRIAWLVTVVALLIGALIMLLSNYQGYAAVFVAVAASAAINLR
jgi:hypothetical protein